MACLTCGRAGLKVTSSKTLGLPLSHPPQCLPLVPSPTQRVPPSAALVFFVALGMDYWQWIDLAVVCFLSRPQLQGAGPLTVWRTQDLEQLLVFSLCLLGGRTWGVWVP